MRMVSGANWSSFANPPPWQLAPPHQRTYQGQMLTWHAHELSKDLIQYKIKTNRSYTSQIHKQPVCIHRLDIQMYYEFRKMEYIQCQQCSRAELYMGTIDGRGLLFMGTRCGWIGFHLRWVVINNQDAACYWSTGWCRPARSQLRQSCSSSWR